MDNEVVFFNKLKVIRKKIYSSYPALEIDRELDHLYRFIQDHYTQLSFLKKLDEMVNAILIERVIKDSKYANHFLKKYLNVFVDRINADIYTAWGLIFSKILADKIKTNYPSVFFSFFKIYLPRLQQLYPDQVFSFPLPDELDLQSIIQNWKTQIEDSLCNSSSYRLFFQSKARNQLILSLYQYYREKSALTIWFPFSGLGMEPLLFSFLFHLIHEVETGETRLKKMQLFCSDHDFYLLKEGLRIQPFKEYLLKTKRDFARENGLAEKQLTTSLKNALKAISCYPVDLIYKGDLLDKNYDIVLLNSLKLSDLDLYQPKILKILNKLKKINRDLMVILELSSPFKTELEKFKLQGIERHHHFQPLYFFEPENYYSYQFFMITAHANSQLPPSESDPVLKIYHQIDHYQPGQLKKIALNIKIKEVNENKCHLNYAYILAKANLFNKAYKIVKEFYQTDYQLAYRVLEFITSDCKNKKIVERCRTFIREKELKERGFTAELLDAIVEEIETFYQQKNKKQNQDEKWL